MNNVDYYLINFICDFLLLLVIQGFYKSLLRIDDSKKIFRWVSSVCWYAGTIFINEFFHIPILNLITNFMLMFVMAFAFRGKILKKIIIPVLISVLSAACDLLAYTLTAPLLGEERYYYSFVFTVVFMFIIERIIGYFIAKNVMRDVVGKELMILVIIPILVTIILYCITASCIADIYMTIASCAVVGICIVSFIIYNDLNHHLDMVLRQNQLESQMEAYKRELTVIQDSDRKMQNIRHDLKNHLLAIEGFAEKGNDSEIIKYIDEMRKDINPEKRIVHTGKYEIDSLINYLLEDAESKGIRTFVDIKIPEDIEISYYKLNIIIGNLLENAIDAAILSQKKEIMVIMKYDRGMLYVKIVNSFSQFPIVDGNMLKSSKKDGEGHGIGLRSVKDIVERQNGTMNVFIDEYGREFTAEVMVFIE